MSDSKLAQIVRYGLFLALPIVLFSFKSLLFPYITSKQLFFNILIEILVAFWLTLVIKFPAWRPKKFLVSGGLFAYILVILASCFFSVDPQLSFWGDAERMLSFFHIFHFFLFYLMLITVFQTRKDWRQLLAVSVGFASLVSFIGLVGQNRYSTIGNTAYVSGYLIFNIYFAALLFLWSKKGWQKGLLVALAILMGWQFIRMKTSGAIIGLGASVMLMVLIGAFLSANKKFKVWLLSAFAVLAALVIFVFSSQQADWFQSRPYLKNLTFAKNTFQTRLISWRGAIAEFPEHPVIGTGFGTYAITFDKTFDPKFYDYTRSETYFDRAHNNLLDILSTTGALGLITYLSVFIFALYYLYIIAKRKGFRLGRDENGKDNFQTLLLLGLMAAYFIQNLAIFDSLVTYIGAFILLGYIYFLYHEGRDQESEPKMRAINGPRLLAVLLVLAFIAAYQANLKPWRTFAMSIDSYVLLAQGHVDEALDNYGNTFKNNTPLDRDGRISLVSFVNGNADSLRELPGEQALRLAEYSIELARQNLALNPQDSLMALQLAQAYDVAAQLSYEDPSKFDILSAAALEAIDTSIASSPRRIPPYFVKAKIQFTRGETQAALETVRYGVSLNENYPDGHCLLGRFAWSLNQKDEAYEQMSTCLDLSGTTYASMETLDAMMSEYLDNKDYDKLMNMAELIIRDRDKSASVLAEMAKLYYLVGDNEKAQETAREAIALDSSVATSLEAILQP